MGEIRIKRLEPIHDPEAHERVMRILGVGLRRGVLRLQKHPQLNTQSALKLEWPPEWAVGLP